MRFKYSATIHLLRRERNPKYTQLVKNAFQYAVFHNLYDRNRQCIRSQRFDNVSAYARNNPQQKNKKRD